MNRTIKCRAWDKKGKHFVYLDMLSGSVVMRDMAKEFTDTEMWELFTGQLDTEGVEIYEGDIVEYLNDMGYKAKRRVVEWVANFNRIGFNFGTSKRYHLIGNIHENPELVTPEVIS